MGHVVTEERISPTETFSDKGCERLLCWTTKINVRLRFLIGLAGRYSSEFNELDFCDLLEFLPCAVHDPPPPKAPMSFASRCS